MKIRLVLLSADLLARLCEDPTAALRSIATVAPANIEWLKLVAVMSRDFHQHIGAQPPWTGYLALNEESNEVVGTCGFKGNPNPGGEVGIAYGTFKAFESCGVATAMARQLTALARRELVVRRVIAHTLPERTASCRVLEKSGYKFVGEVIDPEDGKVWRWEYQGT